MRILEKEKTNTFKPGKILRELKDGPR